MSYISHEDYKNLMSRFQKETPKGVLKESVEEGNAFTAALAKTKKGGKAKVGGKEITDTSGYDDPSVAEDYNARYPGSEKLDNIFKEDEFEEGLHMPPLQATGPTIDTVEEDSPFSLSPKQSIDLDYDPEYASRFEPDYMKTPGEIGDEDEDDFDELGDEDDIIGGTDDDDDLPASFRKAVVGDRDRLSLREDQAPFGFDVLSPDEKKQLREYINSVKTIQKEIAKLAAKAGKKVKMEGGDMTGLTMTNSTMSEKEDKE